MKLTSYLTASTIALFLVFGGCNKDPENTYEFYTFTGKLDPNCDFNQKGYECYEKIGNVKIELFANKTDLLAGKNVKQTYYTDANGFLSYKLSGFNYSFVKATKDGLNNMRMIYLEGSYTDKKISQGNQVNLEGTSCSDDFVDNKCIPKTFKEKNTVRKVIILGSTPCKLTVEAFKNGSKLNSDVKVYLSEADRNAKRVYKATDLELVNLLFQEDDSKIMTGYGGIFIWLEPRKYWITVDDKIPTPATTDGPLKDDPNITTSLQVALP